MLRKRLIPGLLLRRGRLVKGIRYRNHRDAGRPATTARAHNAQGADEVALLDIDAARENRGPDLEMLREVTSECFMPVTFGGGVRSEKDAADAMESGADKLCLTTTALENPDLIDRLAHIYGSQAIVLGVDYVGGVDAPCLYDHRTDAKRRDRKLLDWIEEGVARGAGEIRLMAADREGMRKGMDIEMISQVRAAVSVPVVAEGGAGSLDDLAAGLEAGADGVSVGTMLVFSDNNLVKIKRFLSGQGCNMRL